MLSDSEKQHIVNSATNYEILWKNGDKLFPIYPPKVACVYALKMANGNVKIGISQDVFKRKNTVKSASGIEIIDFYYTGFAPRNFILKIEKRCHETFKNYRTNGEFFNITFEEACAELDKYADEIAEALKAADCKFLEEVDYYNELEKSYFENAAEPTLNRVYAMEFSDGTVKIGRSSNIEARQKQIESENGVKVLRVYYTDFLPLETAAQIETDCHKFFAEFLARGKEFFNVSFEDACAAIDNFSVPPQFETPALDFSPREKVETLKFLIERCKDENLRDEIIKSAYEILIA